MTSSLPPTLPVPLTPPNCDLRSFDWFPFYHKRLLQSAFWSRASDAACRISVDLWSKAYQQVPAASLPSDDYLLAEWAGFGRRGLARWQEVRNEVLEPWVLCFDGRLYHPVLSEVACKAWVERRFYLWQRECGRIKKENVRRREKNKDAVLLEFPKRPSDNAFFDEDGVYLFEGHELLSEGQDCLSRGQTVASIGAERMSSGQARGVTVTSHGKPKAGSRSPPENVLKGRGTGTGTTPLGISSQGQTESFGSETTSRTGAHAREAGNSAPALAREGGR